MHLTGRLTSVAANDHAIAGTTYDDRPLSIVVADRATLTPTTWLPVGDHEGNYSPGLHTLALSDDDRVVLFRVGMVGKSVGVRVVAWDTRTGQLSLVSRTNASIQVDFATGLLLGTG